MPWEIAEVYDREGELTDKTETGRRGWIAFLHNGNLKPQPSDLGDVYPGIQGTIKIGDAFPGRAGLRCISVRPRARPKTDTLWDVFAHYAVPEVEPTPDSFDDFMTASGLVDPTNPFRPKRSGHGITIEEYSPFDLTLPPKPFVNAADQPLRNIPSISVPVQVRRVTFAAQEPADDSQQGSFMGRYLLHHVSFEEMDHLNRVTGVRTGYFQNTYEVWKHPYRQWGFVFALNVGTQIWAPRAVPDGLGGTTTVMKLVDITDDNGHPITEPVPINDDGTDVLGRGIPATRLQFKVRIESILNIPHLPLA